MVVVFRPGSKEQHGLLVHRSLARGTAERLIMVLPPGLHLYYKKEQPDCKLNLV